MNLDKTEFIFFNQDGTISSLNGKLLKLVVQFIYLGSNISSAERDVSIHIGIGWIAIHVIDHMETFQLIAVYSCTNGILIKCLE